MLKNYLPVTILLGITLTACQASVPLVVQPNNEVISVAISPSLSIFTTDLDYCARQQPSLSLSVGETPIDQMSLQSNQLLLRWSYDSNFADENQFVIGNETLVPVVHPENPISSINYLDLKAIFEGTITSWNDLTQNNLAGSIQVWVPSPSDEAWQLFSQAILDDSKVFPAAWIAPQPSGMRSAVAEVPLAIGLLPSSWVDDSVKAVKVTGADLAGLSHPILAVTSAPPADSLYELLICLQEQISGK